MKKHNLARVNMFLIGIVVAISGWSLATENWKLLLFSSFTAIFVALLEHLAPTIPRLGRWLSNIYNPSLPDAERYLTYSMSAMQNGGSAMKQEWQYHLDWIKENLLGPPKETDTYSIKELTKMGLVGIYSKQESTL